MQSVQGMRTGTPGPKGDRGEKGDIGLSGQLSDKYEIICFGKSDEAVSQTFFSMNF